MRAPVRRRDLVLLVALAVTLRLVAARAIPLGLDPSFNCAPDEAGHFWAARELALGHDATWPESLSIYSAYLPAPYLAHAAALALLTRETLCSTSQPCSYRKIRQRSAGGALDKMAIDFKSGGAAGDAHIAFADVHMAFGDRPVFRGLSCAFPAGKISVILGGSGSGKSTVLRLIGGLVRPLSGHIYVTGEDVTTLSEANLYGVRKKLGMMFQGGALLDSLSIFDNLAFPLREHTSLDEDEIARQVRRRLNAVGLADVDALLPNELSGGMMKRAALARAIMLDPVILLCDEPFSGLDPLSVKRIEALLVRLNHQRGITILLVSHHIASTMRMADRVLLLFSDGPIAGSPAELRASGDLRVAAFLSEGDPDDAPDRRIDTAAGSL